MSSYLHSLNLHFKVIRVFFRWFCCCNQLDILKNVLKRAHAPVPATLFWRETFTVCNVTRKVHQHASSIIRNKTFPYIRISDSIPLVFQVYLKFYVCLQSVSCEVCKAFFQLITSLPRAELNEERKFYTCLYPRPNPLPFLIYNCSAKKVSPVRIPLYEGSMCYLHHSFLHNNF